MKNTASLIRRGAARVRSSRVESEHGRVSSRGCLMHVRLRAEMHRFVGFVRFGWPSAWREVATGGSAPLINEVRTRGYLSADASNLSALLDSIKNHIYDPVRSPSTPMRSGETLHAIALADNAGESVLQRVPTHANSSRSGEITVRSLRHSYHPRGARTSRVNRVARATPHRSRAPHGAAARVMASFQLKAD